MSWALVDGACQPATPHEVRLRLSLAPFRQAKGRAPLGARQGIAIARLAGGVESGTVGEARKVRVAQE